MKTLIIYASLGFASCAFAGEGSKQVAATFPVIIPAVQKERDEMRKQILDEELAVETARLAKSQAELSVAMAAKRPGMDIAALKDALRRHESNIASLNQELARMAPQAKGSSPVRGVIALKAVAPTPAAPAAPLLVSKFDGYQKSADQEDDPYDGYAISISE